jgi:hypothetical protein
MEDYFTKNMKQWFHNISHKLMVPVLMLLFAGASVSCTSLPDVGPFVDATYELKSAVAESGSTVASELQYINDGGTNYADQLTEAWKERRLLLQEKRELKPLANWPTQSKGYLKPQESFFQVRPLQSPLQQMVSN